MTGVTDTPRPPRGPWSEELRLATAAHHRRTERLVDVRTSFASRAAYRDLLEVLLGFHDPLETRLRSAALPNGLEQLPPRSNRLEVDIRALGGTPAAVARCQLLPALSPSDRALGVLYVVEGSALGGEVLAGVAARRLGLTAGPGATFYASEVGRQRWDDLLEAVEARGEAGALATVIDGAIDAFDHLGQWLTTARRPPTQTDLPGAR